MQNPEQVIISQYLSSPVMRTLLGNWNDNLDPQNDLLMFYNTVWNIATASGYGLDVWGRIVGVTRYVQAGATSTAWLGFAGSEFQPWNVGVWYDGSPLAPTSTALSESAFRTLILLKALINLSDCSAQSLNRILQALYAGRGRCFVTDNLDMSFTYTFDFIMTSEDFSVLENGVLDGPAGVSYVVVQGV